MYSSTMVVSNSASALPDPPWKTKDSGPSPSPSPSPPPLQSFPLRKLLMPPQKLRMRPEITGLYSLNPTHIPEPRCYYRKVWRNRCQGAKLYTSQTSSARHYPHHPSLPPSPSPPVIPISIFISAARDRYFFVVAAMLKSFLPSSSSLRSIMRELNSGSPVIGEVCLLFRG